MLDSICHPVGKAQHHQPVNSVYYSEIGPKMRMTSIDTTNLAQPKNKAICGNDIHWDTSHAVPMFAWVVTIPLCMARREDNY